MRFDFCIFGDGLKLKMVRRTEEYGLPLMLDLLLVDSNNFLRINFLSSALSHLSMSLGSKAKSTKSGESKLWTEVCAGELEKKMQTKKLLKFL
jgi:hypothetical protein